MYFYDVEAFMRHCSRKGLAPKTMSSYEQTLRLFGAYLEQQEIRQTERIRHAHIESYISYLHERGKYTIRSYTPTTDPAGMTTLNRVLAKYHVKIQSEQKCVSEGKKVKKLTYWYIERM